MTEAELTPIIEALIYVAEEPITESVLVEILGKEHREMIHSSLNGLADQYRQGQRGMEIREIAGGFRMATKPEYHEWVRKYLKQQTPPMRLSLAALETLAVIAYRQPVTVPEIQEVRGVNAVGVLKNLIDKKLVTNAGRKNVIGRPILYRTTKEFLLQFGLKSLDELPSLEEFEELAQTAFGIETAEPAFGSSAVALHSQDTATEGKLSVEQEEPAGDSLLAECPAVSPDPQLPPVSGSEAESLDLPADFADHLAGADTVETVRTEEESRKEEQAHLARIVRNKLG